MRERSDNWDDAAIERRLLAKPDAMWEALWEAASKLGPADQVAVWAGGGSG